MIASKEKLANRLLYLPLDLHEKVLLWLAYRGLKPVSEITVERRNLALFRRLLRQGKPKISTSTYDSNSPKIKRITKWIQDAGMFTAAESKYPSSWHVSRNKNKAILSAKIIRKFDYENEYLSGILLGYPKESVKAYAHNRILKLGEEQTPVIWPGLIYIHPYLKSKYYAPYIFYAIRADIVKKDGQTAKTWADNIQREIPLLAKWYEKQETDRRKKESKPENITKLQLKRSSQTITQITIEYSKETKIAKEILLKALQEYANNLLNDFQLASICHKLRKRLSISDKKDNDLLEILTIGENIYTKEKRLTKKAITKKAEQTKRLLGWLYKTNNIDKFI